MLENHEISQLNFRTSRLNKDLIVEGKLFVNFLSSRPDHCEV